MSSPVAQKLYGTATNIKIQKQSPFLAGLQLRDFKKLGLQLWPWARIQTPTRTPAQLQVNFLKFGRVF